MHEIIKVLVRGVYNLGGLDSPFSSQEYGPNWTRQRNKCLRRDNYCCRVCDIHMDEIGREPSVHHIKPRSQFNGNNWTKINDVSNLISLCPSCHGKYEGKFTNASPEEFVLRAREH